MGDSEASIDGGAWPRPQLLCGLISILLCLASFYSIEQHTVSLPRYQAPPPVIRSTLSVRPAPPNTPLELAPPSGAPVLPQVTDRKNTVDCSLTPCLALTFDDGPNPVTTPKVLDALEAAGVPATFFVIGSHVPGNELILQRMRQDGSEIGNHSWSHHDFTTLTVEQMLKEINLTQEVIMKAGVPAPTLFRPPYGAVNSLMRSHIPLTVAMWNADPEDWKTPDPNQVIARVEAQAGPGRVITLHDVHESTAQAMTPLLQKLKGRYRFVTVSQLFNLAPGQRGEFFGR